MAPPCMGKMEECCTYGSKREANVEGELSAAAGLPCADADSQSGQTPSRGEHYFIISNTTHAAYTETPTSPTCRAGMQVLLRRSIYRILADVVSYTDDYRSVQKLVSGGTRSAAQVVRQYDATTWLNAHLADCLCQIAGIRANCMNDLLWDYSVCCPRQTIMAGRSVRSELNTPNHSQSHDMSKVMHSLEGASHRPLVPAVIDRCWGAIGSYD